MVEVYDSHEQGERVKSWLRDNGGSIVMGLVLAFGALFGFKQWQVWEINSVRQASAEYETLVELLSADQLDAAVANYETLKSEYERSPYTSLAALHMARARVEAGQPELADTLLRTAMESNSPQPVKVIARERLARLTLDQGDPDGAMALLDGAPSETGFEARFAEIRGDIESARGNNDAAIEQYTLALEQQETGIGFRPLLEMKLEALGGEVPGEADS